MDIRRFPFCHQHIIYSKSCKLWGGASIIGLPLFILVPSPPEVNKAHTPAVPTTQKKIWVIRPGHLLSLLHCPVLMLTCPLLAPTVATVRSTTLSELWCTVHSDTCLLWQEWHFLAICATVPLLWDQTRLATFSSPHPNLGHPWSQHLTRPARC